MAALIWNNDNDLATPACKNAVDGLTDLGREVVTRMHACHMAVDVSHLNEAGTLEIIKTGVPPLASHSSVHALCAHTRNLKDTQLRLLFEVGGYVGINFYPPFLTSHGVADLDLVIDHIAYVCDLGGENYVGLGSDFDGIDQKPIGLQNASHLPALFDRMSQRGFDAPLIEKIAGQNIAQYFERLM